MEVRKGQTVVVLTKKEANILDEASKIIHEICSLPDADNNCTYCPFSELCGPNSMRISAFEETFDVQIKVEDE